MHRFWLNITFPLLLTSLLLVGCDDLFGSKQDDTTDEIFDAGRIEPGLISEVEYIPLTPFFTVGGDLAPITAPQDIYVGYDELIYMVDARGLHVFDLAGRPALFLPIDGGGTSVVQDRRLDVYVTARRDTMLNGQNWNLPVIIHYTGITTGSPRVNNVIWHPFDDDSRKFNRPDPIDTDELVEFTGVAVLRNNSIYVSRRGPVNDRTSVILPHNTILNFTPEGINLGAILALNPTRPSLRSAINPADVLTFIQPPQRSSFSNEQHFIIAQSSALDGNPDSIIPGTELTYSVLSIRAVETNDGIEYRPDTQRLQSAFNPNAGEGFLYEEFKFTNPSDLALAADGTNYLYVLDSAKDSLFIFTAAGIEGVAPPPGSQSTTPVPVSFGGTGDGALNFNRPNGVAYFDRIVYVADTGNNRISRFKLNTDFE